jgi:hypothetical protein
MPSPLTVVPWQRLYNDIKIQIPGATDAVIKQELFRCAKDFCDQTNIWTEEVPFVVTPNVVSYTVTPAGKGAPNRLIVVYDPSYNYPMKNWVANGISMEVPGVINLMYSPASAANWVARYAKTPTDPVDADGYPDIDTGLVWIIDKYRDAFMFGTLARLQNQPSKTYSNPKSAAFNFQNYITQRGKARTDALKMNVFGGQQWSYPQGYASTTRKGWA